MAKDIFSVSEINNYISGMFENDFMLKNICIKGEISNITFHTSGHIYFTLKDEDSCIAGVMFRGNRAKGLTFPIKTGDKVNVSGRIGVYNAAGKYQIYATSFEQAGLGELYQRYEELKKEFEEMGMFDESYKRPIPRFSTKIGVVTAETGAAIHDIITTSTRRNPHIEIILYPSLVQGAGAAPSIVRGIETLDELDLDVIIVGRGGGSIEDLWAFNEEEVARAVFNAKTPIISAVGHEVDYTICDFVADKRAATPTAAAEMAVFEYDILRDSMINIESRLDNAFSRTLDSTKAMVEVYKNRLGALSPTNQLTQLMLRLSDINNRLDNAITIKLNETRHRLENDASKLDLLSPAKKLSSGFSYVVDDSGRNVTKASSLNVGDDITVYFSEGKVLSRINKIEE